jgi:tyrosyl-tRNA synthetase
MSTYKSEFLHVLSERGFIQQISEPEALDALARSSPITAYIGFDCTAPSLHVGSLLPIMLLYWLQWAGHRPIALMGGGTTRVGDPSGKEESRKLLSEETISNNLRSIRSVIGEIIDFEGQNGNAIFANNADWLDNLNYIAFLRDIGAHFSVNRMLSFDSVKLRLARQQELSFLEFNYMILQAYDFLELHKRYDCVLQMGGSDQWGNIVSGIELGRRAARVKLFGLTAPLISTSSGSKMGKTAAGAVWLDPSMTGHFEFWQFWRNTSDEDVIRFLKLFTKIPLDEINRFENVSGEELNEAKETLAEKVTEIIYGKSVAKQLAAIARDPRAIGTFDDNLPTLVVNIGDGILSANTQLRFSFSNAQARQFVKDGAMYLGARRIVDPNYRFGADDFDELGRALLRTGSRKRAILKLKRD